MHALRSDITVVLTVPAVEVLVEEVIVLQLLLITIAVTLTVQLLPAIREEMVSLLCLYIFMTITFIH